MRELNFKMIEKLSFKKKVLPSVMAIGMACGMAFSGSAHAIEIAADGAGQVLIAPFYLTKYVRGQEGNRNLITLINTSTTHAAKIKAVFRSQKYCRELLDFLIILSPGDAWRGEIYHRVSDDTVRIRSTDDSIRNLPNGNSFANIESVDQQLYDGNLAGYPGDDLLMGHIEFIGHYTASGTVNFFARDSSQQDVVVIKRGMSKTKLAKLFETTIPNIVSVNDGCPPVGASQGVLSTTCPVRINDTANFKIRGNVEIVYPDGERMVYQMTALKSSDTGFLIENPSLEVYVNSETAIGDSWGFQGANNTMEIENALATTAATGSYEQDEAYKVGDAMTDSGLLRRTAVQVTFPTKYRHHGEDVCSTGKTINKLKGQLYPPFTVNGEVKYQMLSYNNSENIRVVEIIVEDEPAVSGIPGVVEVVRENVITNCSNLIFPTADDPMYNFPSGVYKMVFIADQGNGGCATKGTNPYNGVPAIVQTYKYTIDRAETTVTNHLLTPTTSTNEWPVTQ
jgi:hypothetical protein